MIRIPGTLVALLLIGAPQASAQAGQGRSIAIEAAGATVGSAIGVVVTLRIGNDCDVEDLGCLIRRIGTAGVGSVVGATVGAYSIGKAADTRPSLGWTFAGAVVGAGAGAGMLKLLEEAGVRPEGAGALAAYSVTQGVTTALVAHLRAAF